MFLAKSKAFMNPLLLLCLYAAKGLTPILGLTVYCNYSKNVCMVILFIDKSFCVQMTGNESG